MLISASPTVMAADAPSTAAPVAPNEVVYIAKYNCTQLLKESDAARSSALLFYYGYAMGQRNISAYQPPQMGQQLQRVLDVCKRNPDMPVNAVFNTVLDG